MSMYSKNSLKIFFRSEKLGTAELGIKLWRLEAYQICSNGDKRLTSCPCMKRSNLHIYTCM